MGKYDINKMSPQQFYLTLGIIGTIIVGLLVTLVVTISEEVNKRKLLEKPSKLEKQIINVSPSDSKEINIYDEKTGINYKVNYTKGDTLNLVPYEIKKPRIIER